LDKYKAAGEIANEVLKLVIAKLVVGAVVVDVCAYGD